ncbi:MAG: SUMF1/EgtB/PvdO family nonheme iron enzyme [Solirubrobacterales bacterium]
MNPAITRPQLVLAAAAIFALLVGSLAAASPSAAGDRATASASVKKKLKKLNKKVTLLQQELDEVSKQPGPQGAQGPPGAQGPQGPAGTAPVCAGNSATDRMVAAGAVCIDRYEASVWSQPNGGTQYGVSSDDYPCGDDGQDCDDIYARSVAGVPPSRFISYFQAQQALANSGKRLPTSAEWQQAVAGTPDPGASPGSEDCNTSSPGPEATGERTNCISTYGANDMVGNLGEHTADWDEQAANACANWIGGDIACLGRASEEASSHLPGVLQRGGGFANGTTAGPFLVGAQGGAAGGTNTVGFRGAR